MSIDLPVAMEAQVRKLAENQGRDVRGLIEDAVRLYIESESIDDLAPEDVAETQMALLHELSSLDPL